MYQKPSLEEVVTDLVSLLTPTPGSSTPTPFVANQEWLIGKRIHHRLKDSSGTELWYYNTILSLVPGTTDWFNVKYDGEDTILSRNLIDIEKGVSIMSVEYNRVHAHVQNVIITCVCVYGDRVLCCHVYGSDKLCCFLL